LTVRIGTSGWVYPHWQGVFYPEDLPRSGWFEYYARQFKTVEINNTFYRLPQEKTFEAWAAQAPPGFCYAVKANRYLTHMKKLKPDPEALHKFLGRARRLGRCLGPILWQLPPGWHANPQRLAEHAQGLPKDLIHAFEFRDADWFRPEIRQVLAKHELTFCIYDVVEGACPLWVTGSTVYLRFHGAAVKYGGGYGEARLEPWAERIRQWNAEGRDVYAYFNNDLGGFAPDDARTLRRLLGC
jgi:uncharacterized protein YecE (DUF72 family)